MEYDLRRNCGYERSCSEGYKCQSSYAGSNASYENNSSGFRGDYEEM